MIWKNSIWHIQSILKDNDNILIKASHAMKFADIVELLSRIIRLRLSVLQMLKYIQKEERRRL